MSKKSFHLFTKFSLLLCLATITSFSITAQFKNDPINGQSLAAPFIQKSRLAASDGSSIDIFGNDVVVKGDVAVIGAPQDDGVNVNEGSAYIFTRSGNIWTQQQKLTAADLGRDSYFGSSIAISGDTIAIGAYANGVAGAVYVFVRTGTTWNLQQKLTPSDSPARALFGWTVGINSDTIIVGAKDADNLNGAAYVFVRSGTTWTQQQKIFTNEETGSRFGHSVAISGDTIAIGASGNFVPTVGVIGAAYIYTRSGTNWIQQQKLVASDGQSGDYMGTSIAIENDTLVVGSQSGTLANSTAKGAAYVFTRSGTSWTQKQKLVAADGGEGDKFGASVAISGNKVIVGAYLARNGTERAGSAYIFELSESVWNQAQKINLAPELNFPQFGRSVAIAGDTIIVGAPGEYGNVGAQQGAAYIFAPQVGSKPFDFDGDGRADAAVYRPSNGVWYINGSQNGFFGAQFGISTDKIAPADYDGDAKTDIAVYRDGFWYILNSADNSFRYLQFGLANDIPIPADYDGDGKADINLYRPSSNVWYRLNSSNGQFFYKLFGVAGDKPIISNFDGDNKTDIALYRSSNSTFYWINSTTNADASAQIGIPGDIPTASDFDGDGKTDVAVFRPASAIWYRRNSSDNAVVPIFFGSTGDIPVAADYNGDSLTDIAVFRPSNGVWYFLQSSGGYYGYNFGVDTDRPIPAAY